MEKIKVFIKDEISLNEIKKFLDSYNFKFLIEEEILYDIENEQNFIKKYIVLKKEFFDEFKILFSIFKEIENKKQENNSTKKTIKNIKNKRISRLIKNNEKFDKNKNIKKNFFANSLILFFLWFIFVVFLIFIFIITF